VKKCGGNLTMRVQHIIILIYTIYASG